MMAPKSEDLLHQLRGPILVLGAGGFVGANLFHRLDATRNDVFGVVHTLPNWRLRGVEAHKIIEMDFNDPTAVRGLIETTKAATIFNCVAYGAYSFESDPETIYRTNLTSLVRILELMNKKTLAAFIQAGSSSEYGLNCEAPDETGFLSPNSHYAVSKAASANLINYVGKVQGLPVANLRLYSVYGPYEDTSRLIPSVIKFGLSKAYPQFVNPDISRDFVHVDDACNAFMMAAVRLKPENYGDSFNIWPRPPNRCLRSIPLPNSAPCRTRPGI
jgi:dolichol-phosphate mannosyltransferase